MNTPPPVLGNEEARRAQQHDVIKSEVVEDIHADIADRAARGSRPGDLARIDRAAGEIREHAIDEAVDDERAAQRSRGIARASQVIDYAFFLVYTLLLVRFVLAAVGARPDAGFVKFIATITGPLYAPFRNIVDSPAIGSSGHVLLPALIALFAYLILHVAINRLLRMFVVRKTQV